MKITDLKCAVIGQNPIIRIVTDEGIDGYGQAENSKPYLKPHVLFYKRYLMGEDPTDVNRIMLKIRRMGAFKPWGAAVSAIEFALWDIAGKAAGLPVYKLLGGKVRDRVRVYNGGVRFPMRGTGLDAVADNMAQMKAAKENFGFIKQGIGFHSPLFSKHPEFLYGEAQRTPRAREAAKSSAGEQGRDSANRAYGDIPDVSDATQALPPHPNRAPLTEKGLKHIIASVEAMKDTLGDEVGLALDCGPGWMVPDAIRLAKALEPLNIMWLEDTITGDYTPYVLADLYRELTRSTITPIHTGEQIYLRENFRELIETHAVNVVGPDPADVGGIAELKWIAEYADLHGILMAPHGVIDGLIGLAAHVHLAAALPPNFIGFEYPVGRPAWWYDIIEGLPDPIVADSHIEVWDSPGLGVTFNIDKAVAYLSDEDQGFFD